MSQPVTTENKLHKDIEKVILDLANSHSELKNSFKGFSLLGVENLKLTCEGRKVDALILYVPYPFLHHNRSLLSKIINEVTKAKKLSTFVVARRTIVHPRSDYKQIIPRNRTLTSVYDSILEDLVYPANIIGRRYRYRLDGTRLTKIHINDDMSEYLADRAQLICEVYNKLTNRKIVIEFKPETNYCKIPAVRKSKKVRKEKAK